MSEVAARVGDMETMLVDCNACAARGPACGECVVSVLMGAPDAAGSGLHPEEVRALDAMSAGGLLPPLRLVHVSPVVEEAPTRGVRRRA